MVTQTHHRPAAQGRRHCRRPALDDGFDLAAVLPVVRNEVRRFRPWRLERDDLIQAGVAGALEAWRRRDPDRPGGLRSYTSSWVRKEVQQTMARGDFTVAVPADVPMHAVALRRHLDRGTSAEGAGRRLGLGRDQTTSLERLLESDRDHAGGFDVTWVRSADPLVEDAVLEHLDRDAIRRAVAGLAEPHRTVVLLRFGFDGGEVRSTREVGRLVGVSDFTVRAHLRQATAVLRARLASLR